VLLQIPGVLEPGELASLRQLIRGAAFEDGMATGSPGARRVKHNLQLPDQGEAARAAAPMVLDALRRNSTFFSAALPKRISGPLFNRYDVGMDYGNHVDTSVILGEETLRSDIAATLFLTPPEEYDGGELVIEDSYGAHRVKLPAGSMIVYPASSIHRVERVTRGSRISAVFWIQSLVRAEAQRRLLFQLDLAIGSLSRREPGAIELQGLGSVYHNLLRLWTEA
jgi:PKHD-type hydroxylase